MLICRTIFQENEAIVISGTPKAVNMAMGEMFAEAQSMSRTQLQMGSHLQLIWYFH